MIERVSPDSIGVVPATLEDVRAIHIVLIEAARKLEADFGGGPWARPTTRRTLRNAVEEESLHAVWLEGEIVGTFRVSDRKIPFYRKGWFANPDDPAIYLRDMAIAPRYQRAGVGRAAMAAIEEIARTRELAAVRFDAYEGPAGAGPFYRKCGYTLVHCGPIGETALEYYEKVLR